MFTGQIPYQLTVQHLPKIDIPIIKYTHYQVLFWGYGILVKRLYELKPCSLHVLSLNQIAQC